MEYRIRKCDICYAEQRSDDDIYWASRVSRVAWRVPPDGLNHGAFDGDCCQDCRTRISKAIDDTIRSLRDEAKARKSRL